MPPQSTEYIDRLLAFHNARTNEIKGYLAALEDVVGEKVNGAEDVYTLLEAGKRKLAEEHPEEAQQFLFGYTEELERVLASITHTKRKGAEYDA